MACERKIQVVSDIKVCEGVGTLKRLLMGSYQENSPKRMCMDTAVPSTSEIVFASQDISGQHSKDDQSNHLSDLDDLNELLKPFTQEELPKELPKERILSMVRAEVERDIKVQLELKGLTERHKETEMEIARVQELLAQLHKRSKQEATEIVKKTQELETDNFISALRKIIN